MSGRWRSRHWRSGEGGGPPPDAMRVRERWGDSDSSSGSDEVGRGVDASDGRVANETDVPDDRRPHNSNENQRSSRNEPEDGGEWRRGQPLPSRGGQGTSRGRTAADAKQEKPSNDRAGSAGRARATFASAPAQAWGGHKSSSSGPASDKATAVKAEPRGWARADSNTNTGSGAKQGNDWPEPKSSLQRAAGTTAGAPSNLSSNPPPIGILKREEGGVAETNHNPWASPTPGEAMAIDNTAFPPPKREGMDKKLPAAPGGAPSSSLPSTSSWGKGPAAAQSQAKPTGKKARANEFPSLSTSLKAPRNKPKAPPSAKTATPAGGDPPGKKAKGPSKKAAAPASLASFLSPRLGGEAKGKGAKKKPPTKKANSASSLNKPKPHPSMLAAPKPHPALANMAGVKRSAPSSSSADRAGMADFPIGAKGGAIKKGRQRLEPRKKKLSTLKKQVLKERLRVWQEKNGIAAEEASSESMEEQQSAKRLRTEGASGSGPAPPTAPSTTLLVENYVRPDEDDLADDDERDEILCNLVGLAGRVGTVAAAHVGAAFVRFASGNDAAAARDILNGMVVGGQKIRASVVDSVVVADSAAAPTAESEGEWRTAVLKATEERQTRMDVSNDAQADSRIDSAETGPSDPAATIVFHNILSEDDYADDDALEESVEDIKGLAQQFGPVISARASTSGDERGNVYVAYGSRDVAERSLKQLNGIVIGGSKIEVSLDLPPDRRQSGPGVVVLSNVLNDDDFEDEDCLNESLDDIRTMAEKYGSIDTIHAETSGELKGVVRVTYVDGHQVAEQAAQSLNGMVVGGVTISASVAPSANGASPTAENIEEGTKAKEAPPPMFSGDKIIPERFAACKRVPKIPNSGTPRTYASKIPNEQAVPLVCEMLGELMRLQNRSKDDKNARARRRLVMGLREVARGIRAHKVKMVVMANNLDQYGAIDAKLQEILDLARAEELPVVFELNKRKLGKALGKSIKVSVVGIQNADGAHEQFKKLKKMTGAV
ncbi:hypothetical protein ACHAXT_002138 [Thalassiosira profunda]